MLRDKKRRHTPADNAVITEGETEREGEGRGRAGKGYCSRVRTENIVHLQALTDKTRVHAQTKMRVEVRK